MVTNEELAKMVRKAMYDGIKNPPLQEVSSEKLRKLVEELKEKKKDIRYELSKVTTVYWDLKGKYREADRAQKGARSIVGERNGRNCPCKNYEEDGYYKYWLCEIRSGYHNRFYNVNDLYANKCSTCRTKEHIKRKRLTFKRIFKTVPKKKVI